MGRVTPDALKKDLNVTDWKDIESPEQFYTLMKNFHHLSLKTKNQVIDNIKDLKNKTEDFLKECIDNIIDYEPSLMSEMVDRGLTMKEFAGNDLNQQRKKMVVEMFAAFSKWFDMEDNVEYTKYGRTSMCSICDAIVMAHKNEEKKEKEMIDMFFLSDKRRAIIRSEEEQNIMERELKEMILGMEEDDAELFEEFEENQLLN